MAQAMTSNPRAGGRGQPDKKEEQMAKHTIEVNNNKHYITTDTGLRVSDVDNWLVVGNEKRLGPELLEDQIARERINRFDHERIPERVVHARGVGAFGTFKVFESAEDVTYAGVLTDTSRETPVFVRFSTVLGSRGSADTVRDVRGFAVKMYTEEGNWDIIGNNIPVFFIQDAIKFPDIIHAGKPEPDTEIPQAQTAHNNFWDFQYLHPESTHMFMWATSDRAIPRSLRMMQGFGVNTFRLINKDGKSHFVKFHWTPHLGVHSCVWDEYLKIGGQDPDFHRRDLYEAIENGVYPRWKFGVQVLREDQKDDFDFDILDATKVWPEEICGPVRYIGELELNRNVDDFFAETEQVAFCTSHIVPGIDFSDDPLLQGRNFSYLDTQMSRLGVNFQSLPVNQPVCPVLNHHRDGQLQHRVHKGSVNYWPNRFEAIPPAPTEKTKFDRYPEKLEGIKARLKSEKFKEHINQAQLFYNSLKSHEQAHLQAALGFELDHCEDPVVYSRICERLAEIDLQLAKTVAELVGGPIPEKAKRPNHGKKSAGLSQTYYTPDKPTIETRRVAIIIADGFDFAEFSSMKTALESVRAFPYIIGTRRSPIKAGGQGGQDVKPDHHLEGFRSTMVDAIYIPGGSHVSTLRKSGRALHWVREAFAHCKAIGATRSGVDLVTDACVGLDAVRLSQSDVRESYGVVTGSKLEPQTQGKVTEIAKGTGRFLEEFFYSISQHRNYARELDGLTSQLAY